MSEVVSSSSTGVGVVEKRKKTKSKKNYLKKLKGSSGASSSRKRYVL